jgi:hypothetical protein
MVFMRSLAKKNVVPSSSHTRIWFLIIAHRLAKLAGLLFKTLAKPLSKRIKHDFSRYDLTKRMLIGIGETNHQVSSRMTIWSAGYQVRDIKPLEPEKALAVGADFFGESFLFLVSGGIVVWEYNRSNEKAKEKEAQKHAQLKGENEKLRAKLHSLDVRLKAVEDVVKHNADSIMQIGKRYVAPAKQELVPIDDDEHEEQQQNAKSEVSVLSERAGNGEIISESASADGNTKQGWRKILWPF